jgi:hypothetical protein
MPTPPMIRMAERNAGDITNLLEIKASAKSEGSNWDSG